MWKGGGFNDAYTHRNHQIWYMSSHMCPPPPPTHFDIGTCTVGLPSLGWAGLFTREGGGLDNCLGGV